MLVFPPYFFTVFAIICFVIGYCLSWFSSRSVLSIGTGVAAVIFFGLFVLDWTLPNQPVDPIWVIAYIGSIYAVAGGVPALFGAAVARNLKRVILK